MSKHTVSLIFGGKSTEHEISIISARAIAARINPGRFTLKPVYISFQGHWYNEACSAEILSLDMPTLLRSGSPEIAKNRLNEITSKAADEHFDFAGFLDSTDVAFLALHGSHGEDGTIQGCLDTFGIPYTGCGVAASAVGMDKALTKICAAAAGIEVADFLVVFSHEYLREPQPVWHAVSSRFSWPVFVKPANLGSSVGITKVHCAAELPGALDAACRLDSKVLVETAITGHEIEVALLGNEFPIVSVPGEIVPGREFYDYEDKYIHNNARFFIPAKLSEEKLEQIRNTALTVFKALGCRGMARIDFFVEHGTGRIILNEINTIPGFTDISMYPELMASTGIDFADLVDKLLLLALEKPSDPD